MCCLRQTIWGRILHQRLNLRLLLSNCCENRSPERASWGTKMHVMVLYNTMICMNRWHLHTYRKKPIQQTSLAHHRALQGMNVSQSHPKPWDSSPASVVANAPLHFSYILLF
ncbi:hypothetical protein MTR_8g432380 [Medicago truncatula]|uniref:Uncharacterized protein n=1 Tax=Medicago truncatula TaxID=3880 RepID=A0A072TZI1_MEDTR|nr:hypothetical protein MTR_8g432380 [Medicago truncatula]